MILFWMIVYPLMVFYFQIFSDADTENTFVPPEQLELDVPYSLPMPDFEESIYLNKDDNDERVFVNEFTPDSKVVISSSDSPISLRLCFKNYLQSLQGYWHSNNGWIEYSGALSGNISGPAVNAKSPWGPSVSANAIPIEPCFDVALPINDIRMDAQLGQRFIQIQARMLVKFPSTRYGMINDTQVRGYVNKTEPLAHSLGIYVLNKDELGEYRAIQEQSRSAYQKRHRREVWMSIFWTILICPGIVLLVRLVSKKIGYQVRWKYWMPDFIKKWLIKRRK
jgi:hypothetical protein